MAKQQEKREVKDAIDKFSKTVLKPILAKARKEFRQHNVTIRPIKYLSQRSVYISVYCDDASCQPGIMQFVCDMLNVSDECRDLLDRIVAHGIAVNGLSHRITWRDNLEFGAIAVMTDRSY